MQTIKATTKRGQAFINAYKNSINRSLSDCYKKCSTDKTRAEYFCIQAMTKENGEDFRITSFNSFGFSCAWTTSAGLRVETPSNSYLIS